MKLLVAGGAEVDAGKTTFTTGLIERTGVRGYKPRAGNGYWYDQDDYRRSVEQGRLYGKDSKKIAAASPGDVRPEAINPVHRLWLPTPGRGKGPLGRDGRRFIADRVTPRVTDSASGETASDRVTLDGSDRYVGNADVEVPPGARRAFPLAEAPAVESLEELNQIMADLHAPALAALDEELAGRDAAVVESYSDIARPLTEFVPDAVAVVEPRRCRVFDGERYTKACDVAGGSAHEGRLEERVDHVLDLLDPLASVTLPALSSEERGDLGTVADAYEDAYDELLAAV